MRGKYQSDDTPDKTYEGSPPHMRGIREVCLARKGKRWITPTCAGNAYTPAWFRNDIRLTPAYAGNTSMLEFFKLVWITPAYAGNTEQLLLFPQYAPDHPRMRGEYIVLLFHSFSNSSSPPHPTCAGEYT